MTGFLPAFMLSGFLFEIGSMPGWLQTVTYLLPARYFVASLQTVFLTGDVWAQFLPSIVAMLAIGAVFLRGRCAQHAQELGLLAMRLAAQIVKELRSYFQDPGQRDVVLRPAAAAAVLLSSAATLEVSNVDIAVFNDDSGSRVVRSDSAHQSRALRSRRHPRRTARIRSRS